MMTAEEIAAYSESKKQDVLSLIADRKRIWVDEATTLSLGAARFPKDEAKSVLARLAVAKMDVAVDICDCLKCSIEAKWPKYRDFGLEEPQ